MFFLFFFSWNDQKANTKAKKHNFWTKLSIYAIFDAKRVVHQTHSQQTYVDVINLYFSCSSNVQPKSSMNNNNEPTIIMQALRFDLPTSMESTGMTQLYYWPLRIRLIRPFDIDFINENEKWKTKIKFEFYTVCVLRPISRAAFIHKNRLHIIIIIDGCEYRWKKRKRNERNWRP